jgi:hypothetical protein
MEIIHKVKIIQINKEEIITINKEEMVLKRELIIQMKLMEFQVMIL